MLKRIRLVMVTLFALSLLLVPALSVYAQSGSNAEVCNAINGISPDGGTCDNPSGFNVNRLVTVAVNMLSIVAGVIAVIMMIVSGLRYVTSQGDATQISNAKKSLIYAIVGMVVVAFSQMLVKFVLVKAA